VRGTYTHTQIFKKLVL